MDISKIENLVSMYIELDEDDQDIIFRKTAQLYLAKNDKKENQLLKKRKQKWAEQFENAGEGKIGRDTSNSIEEFNNFMTTVQKLPVEYQAAVLIYLCRIDSKAGEFTKPKVKVTVTYQSKSIKEVISDTFPTVNYEDACRKYEEIQAFFDQIKRRESFALDSP